MQKKKGISIAVLIVTVIIMMILAGVVIIGLNNGEIINMTNEVGVTAQTRNEKIVLDNVISTSLKKNIFGSLTAQELQNSIDELSLNMTAMDNGKTIVVKFDDVDKYYEIKPNGKILGTIEIVKDSTPGAFDGAGTQDDPFIIMSIEDLVYFSKEVNVNKKKYENKYVMLGRNLNFNSELSYVDANTTEYDEYLGGDGTAGLKEQLTTGLGFRPIGENTNFHFAGNFDGNDNEISNLKVDVTGYAGIFGYARGTIKNLGVAGNIISSSEVAGGVVGCAGNLKVTNCYSKGDVISNKKSAGGIIGRVWSATITINGCENYATIDSYHNGSGGMIGYVGGSTVTIRNSCNFGLITTNRKVTHHGVGGVVGAYMSGNRLIIENCYNLGEIRADFKLDAGYQGAGGIISYINKSNTLIRNSINFGEINSKEVNMGGIIGRAQDVSTVTIDINRCYFKNDIIKKAVGSGIAEELGIGKSQADTIIQGFVNELNGNIESGCPYEVENNDGTVETVKVDTTGWAKWVYNENSYPTLDLTTIWDGTQWVKTNNN